MRAYEKKLQFPANIRKLDPVFAKIVISRIDGSDGELAVSVRCLNQRYTMPHDSVRTMLTDIGMGECVHKGYPPREPLSMGNFRVQAGREIICGTSITYRVLSLILDTAQDLLQHRILFKNAHILILQEKLFRH